jgi:hypothetical protein
MKKGFSLLCIVTILFATAPISFAAALTRGNCNTLIGPAKSRCERRQARASEAPNARRERIQSNDLIRQRRLTRRADIGGISDSSIKSIEQLRQDNIESLRKRRVQTQSNFQHRYDERRSRLEMQRKQRVNELRSRFSSVRRNTQGVDRSVLRGRSQRLHGRSQSRRDAIKRAHNACSDLGAGARIQCLQRVRDNTLD